MKIVGLKSENVKRLQAVEINPDGNKTVVIAGRNEQGKSSVLDSILFALAGKKGTQSKPVREGETVAKIELDLGAIVVSRRISESGSNTVTVTAEDGSKFSSPQKLLDQLVGSLAFDPLAFTRMKPKAQADTLRQLVGLDFSELDAKRKDLYEKRTATNRSLKEKTAEHDAIEVPQTIPEGVEVSTLMEQLNDANAENSELRIDRIALTDMENERKILALKIESLKGELAELDTRIETANARIDSSSPIDTAPIQEAISNATAVAATIERHAKKSELAGRIKTMSDLSEVYTEKIKAIDTEKSESMKAAQWPVDGLGFGEEGITYKGLPFEQSSQAEQTEISVAMGAAMSPELRVMLIRDGSLMDDEHLLRVAEFAESRDMQLWIEMATRNADEKLALPSIVIEDGTVKA